MGIVKMRKVASRLSFKEGKPQGYQLRQLLLTLMAIMMTVAGWSQENKKTEVVNTTSGPVQGIVQEGTNAFLGIPYARVERCMPPLPVKAWKDVRVCDHWGPQAMQQTSRPMSEDEMSEQCCVLNGLHGGGFDSGTPAWDPGMWLAKKDVVVVSVTHRLNILGFLDLSTCGEKYKHSGNVGMLDVVQALQWVAKGLFHKAIIMSGTILNVNTKAMTEELGEAVLKELGISKDEVDKIKDVPYKDLYAAGQRAMAASIGTRRPGTPMMWGFGPTPDGEDMVQQPFQPGFPDFSDNIPILIGTTFNELQRQRYNQPMTMQQAREELQRTFGDETDAYIEAFKKAYPQKAQDQKRLPQDLLSIDWLFRPKTLITADAIGGKRKADTYMYMFTVNDVSHNNEFKGSAHGAELKYCFDVLHHYEDQLAGKCITENQKWANFAHDGNPNLGEERYPEDWRPKWKPYTAENGELLELGGTRPTIHHNHDRQLAEIIDRHCFKQLDEFRKNERMKK